MSNRNSTVNKMFNTNVAPVQGDPIKEAHAAAIAKAEQEAAAPKEPVSTPEAVTDSEVVAEAAAEKPVETPAEPVAPLPTEKLTMGEMVGKAVVTDGFQAKEIPTPQPEIIEVNNKPTPVPTVASIAPRAQRGVPPAIQRASGARQRDASPVGSGEAQRTELSADFTSLITAEKQKGTVNAVSIISFLERYVANMAPGRITSAAEVRKNQEGLFDNLMHVIERSPSSEFKRLWLLVVAFAHAYRDAAFNPRFYGRGAKDWTRDPEQFNKLQALLNLLQATAADRDTVNEQVSLEAVTRTGFSEEGRGRMIGFYLK